MTEGIERARRHSVVRHEVPASPRQALPLGNGRLGGLLWMPEGQVCFQFGHTDYWRTGPHMESEFGGYPVSIGRLNLRRAPAFAPEGAHVALELGLPDAKARLVIERADGRTELDLFFDMDRDALVARWRESGAPPAHAVIELQGWRDSVRGEARGNGLLLSESPANTRTPEEEEYLRMLLGPAFEREAHAQATALAVEGAAGKAEASGAAARFVLAPSGPMDALLRLASAVGPGDDHAARALATLEEARRQPYEAALERHRAWWREFWGRSAVALESADGSAERFESYWYMLQYLMASSNRGRRPVKFNFGNWLSATDDKRPWGGGTWYYNQRDVCLAMLPAGRPELARNFFDLYLGAAPLLRQQTRHLFGHAGLFVPETVSPDGAMYLRDRSALYGGPTKFVQLIFSTGLEAALHLHDYARYTGDERFLRERAYPFMKEAVEFFRLHMKKGADGLYHVYPANAHETWWRVRDDLPDLAGLRAVLPRLIALSEAWQVDAEDRAAWREFLDRLAPLPKGRMVLEGEPRWEDRGSGIFGLNCRAVRVDPAADMYAPCVFAEDNEMHNCHPVAIYGAYPFRVTHVGSADRETGVRTFRENVHPWMRDQWAADVVVPAVLGLAQEAKDLLTHFADTQWETALDYTERYGKVANTLVAMLLQGHDDGLYLFPALPAEWDGRFRLRAPGPLEVEAERRAGAVVGVRIRSLRDQTVTLASPWPGKAVRVAEGDREVAALQGARPSWPGRAGAVYAVSAAG